MAYSPRHIIAIDSNSGTPVDGRLWQRHVITTDLPGAYDVALADFDKDGDGDMDVAATSWRNPGRVVWFENQGDPKGRWTRHMLKNNWRSANQIIITDFNGDGRPDIAACAEHGSYELHWWRNGRKKRCDWFSDGMRRFPGPDVSTGQDLAHGDSRRVDTESRVPALAVSVGSALAT